MPKCLVIGCLSLPLFLWTAATVAGEKPDAYREAPAAPALQLQDLRSQPRSLADYRGKVVLVNFWASWCGPCIKEIPSLRSLYEKMAGEPFEILAVNVRENRFKVHKFSRLVKMPFPILLDPDGEAFAAWDAQVLPTSFLVDTQGKIRREVQGPLDWDSDEVLKTIRALVPAASITLTSTPRQGTAHTTAPAAILDSPAG